MCLRFKSPGHNHKSEECQNCKGDGYDHCCSVGQGQTCTGLYLSQIKKPMRHEVHVHAQLPAIRTLKPEALGCDSGCGRGAWPFAVGSLGRGDSFGTPGFDFRYTRSFLRGVLRPYYTPKLKKRTALINQVLGGWVNYFAVGHSSECFSFIKDWVERRLGAIWRMLRNDRASAGSDGKGGGCTTLFFYVHVCKMETLREAMIWPKRTMAPLE